MEVKFWKHTSELWFGWLILLVSLFFGVIFGIILTITNGPDCLFVVFVCLTLILVMIINLFTDKKLLSKVIYCENGIKIIRLKKQIDYISWDDIIEVEETIRAYNLNWLCFVTKDKKINVSLTKKMYDTIMLICPYNRIKTAVNNLDSFKCFHKKDNIIK